MMNGFAIYAWLFIMAGLLFKLAVIAGLVWLVIWAVRRSSSPAGSMSSAKEILQARYARGEINREQYQQMLSDIEK
jgi:putative membrane protein